MIKGHGGISAHKGHHISDAHRVLVMCNKCARWVLIRTYKKGGCVRRFWFLKPSCALFCWFYFGLSTHPLVYLVIACCMFHFLSGDSPIHIYNRKKIFFFHYRWNIFKIIKVNRRIINRPRNELCMMYWKDNHGCGSSVITVENCIFLQKVNYGTNSSFGLSYPPQGSG